jgi:uncharacterized protein YfkK (UPF0435 family)
MDHDSLSQKKIFELLTLCRLDKELYKGFSKFKKKDELITFIVSKNTLPEIEEFKESIDDIGEALESMFQEPLSSFGLSNSLFRARPSREELDEKILEVTKKVKLLNVENSVTFETHDDEEYGTMYRLFKHKYYKRHKNLGSRGEMILFHGTDEKNISDILYDDFSLTVNASHGHRHGKGIYFTNCIDKALYYSEKMSQTKYVFVCLVHVGDIMVGSMNTGIHPKMPGSNKTYDTSVDNLERPIQFVKKCNGSYNILGVLKFDMKDRVSRFPRGGSSGPPRNSQILPPGTKVEILITRGALGTHNTSLKGKTGVTEGSRFCAFAGMNMYRVVIDGPVIPGHSARSIFSVPEYNLRRITNAPTNPVGDKYQLQITNNSSDEIKVYWVPNNINIYDPVLDIRQHGKIMGNITKGLTSSFITYKGDKFMCASKIGYVRIIEIKAKKERVVIS